MKHLFASLSRLLRAFVGGVVLAACLFPAYAGSTGEVARAAELVPIPPGPALTGEEREWLRQHPVIRVAIDPDWAPVDYLDKSGNPAGVSSEYLTRFSRQLGVRFEPVRGRTWGDMMKDLREGGIDMASCIMVSPDRREHLRFTEPYISVPSAIFTRDDIVYLTLRDLAGRRVASVAGYAVTEHLAREYPDLVIVPVKNLREGLTLLSRGEVAAYVDALPAGSYGITRHGFSNLRIAGDARFTYDMAFATPRANPVLAGILQKHLAAVPEPDRNIYYQRWVLVKLGCRTDYALVLGVLGVTTAVILLFAYWNRRLVREIGRRTRLEGELLGAREDAEAANKAKTAFLMNMSHELRTPLNAVLGFAQLMDGDAAATSAQKSHLAAIRRSGRHLLALINDILEVARMETGGVAVVTRDFDFDEVVSGVLDLFVSEVREKGLFLKVEPAPGFPRWLHSDPDRLRTVLFHLVGNAVKFTAGGGVTLRFDVSSGSGDGGMMLVAEVADTGVGIPQEHQASVFNPFDRGAASVALGGGSGLGLPLVKRHLDALGGAITVVSTPGSGSVFKFTLPVRLAVAADAPCAPARAIVVQAALRAEEFASAREALSRLPADVREALRTACAAADSEKMAELLAPYPEAAESVAPILGAFRFDRLAEVLAD